MDKTWTVLETWEALWEPAGNSFWLTINSCATAKEGRQNIKSSWKHFQALPSHVQQDSNKISISERNFRPREFKRFAQSHNSENTMEYYGTILCNVRRAVKHFPKNFLSPDPMWPGLFLLLNCALKSHFCKCFQGRVCSNLSQTGYHQCTLCFHFSALVSLGRIVVLTWKNKTKTVGFTAGKKARGNQA